MVGNSLMRWWWAGAALVAVALVAVVAFSSPARRAGGASAPVLPDRLVVVRTNFIPQNGIPPLRRAVTDAASVEAFYKAVLALPHFQEHSCPLTPYGYHLTFYQANAPVLQGIAEAGGCETVGLGQKNDARVFVASPKFWASLARIMGMPMGKLLPNPFPPKPAPPSPPGFPPSSIAFWDAQHGLLAGGDEIQTTADGGRTWQVSYQNTGVVFAYGKTATGSDYAQAGYVTVACQTNNPSNCPLTLLTTTDGGRTWQPGGSSGDPSFASPLNVFLQVPPLPGPNPCGGQWRTLQSLSFPTAGSGFALCTGMATAGAQNKAVFTTVDGGKTWTLRAYASSLGGYGGDKGISVYGYPYGIFFLPDGHGWLWQTRGGLLTTTDGGLTWQESNLTAPTAPGYAGEARSAWFFSDATGFVLLAGPPHRLVATADGGATWTTVHTWPEPQ